MKSFKKQSDSIVDEFLSKRKKAQISAANTNKKQTDHFSKSSTHFTKIFDSCAGGGIANSCTTTLISTASSRLNPKEDNFLLLNQPTSLGKDVCDLFAVESTVI